MSLLYPRQDQFAVGKVKLLFCYAFSFFAILINSCSTKPTYPSENVTLLNEINDYPAYHLVWSPSGSQLAVSSHSGSLNKSAMYILDVETKEMRLFTKTKYGNLRAEAWTPEETKLLFYSNSSNELEDGIWITDVTDFHAASFFLPVIGVAWSITDQLAISRRESNGELSVSIEDRKTQRTTSLFQVEAVAISPLVWSGDGTKLVFNLDLGESRRRDIYVIDMETQETHQITNSGTNDSPSLSPNGNLVAYVRGDFSGATPSYSLHIMNSEGTCDMEVPGLTDIGSPAWSPDGKWIAFVGKRNQIFLLDVRATLREDFLIKGLSCN